jgi:membrane fusion protein, multidrug efflux system
MRRFQLWIVIGLAAVLGACANASNDAQHTLTPVRVSEVGSGPAAPVIRTTGLLVTKDEMRLSFKVGGVIKRIAVKDGQRVRRGQTLAQIEETEIDAQVEQARQSADKAVRDAERGEKLYADKLISLGQLQDLRTQAAMTKAALQSAQFNRHYATIVAPEDGIVLRRLAQEREMIAVGTPVFMFAVQERGYVVRVGLADREAMQVRLGDRAAVRMDAYPDRQFEAQITEVAGVADERSGLFVVELRLDPTDVRLAGGLVAKVELIPFSASQGVRAYVPIDAIVEGHGDRASVYILDRDSDGRDIVRRREVRAAFIEGDRVAIAEGVQTGERIVTEGSLYVEDGEHVLVKTAS